MINNKKSTRKINKPKKAERKQKTMQKKGQVKNYSKSKPARPNNIFQGANDIYLTKNKIAVLKVNSKREPNQFTQTAKINYYEPTTKNVEALRKATGGVVRVGANGYKYTKV